MGNLRTRNFSLSRCERMKNAFINIYSIKGREKRARENGRVMIQPPDPETLLMHDVSILKAT